MSAGICERCHNITNGYCTTCEGYVAEGSKSFVRLASTLKDPEQDQADYYVYNPYCLQYESLNIDPRELRRILNS